MVCRQGVPCGKIHEVNLRPSGLMRGKASHLPSGEKLGEQLLWTGGSDEAPLRMGCRISVELGPFTSVEGVVGGDHGYHVALIGRNVCDVCEFGGVHAHRDFLGPLGETVWRMSFLHGKSV